MKKIVVQVSGLAAATATLALAAGQELVDCCVIDGWRVCCWIWLVLEGIGF